MRLPGGMPALRSSRFRRQLSPQCLPLNLGATQDGWQLGYEDRTHWALMLQQPRRLQQDLLGELVRGCDAFLELNTDHNFFAAGFTESNDAAHEDRAVAENRLF